MTSDTSGIRISVQICTYNRQATMRQCLSAFHKVDFPPSDYEIVVVDDGSTDGTGEMISSLDLPCRLEYICKEHAGLAAGRNAGIRRARAPIILFIDDDTIAHPNLLREHWETHQWHADTIVMGWVNHVESFDVIGEPRFTHSDISTHNFWTSNVSVPKRCLEEAGMFDEDFTEYGWEDVEIGYRLRRLGVRRVFNSRAIVFHCKPRWTAQDIPSLIRRAGSSGRSAVIYVSKHPCLRARLSTGVFRLRLALDRLLRPTSRFWEWVATRPGRKRLSGFPLFCARTLVSFHYFQAVREALAKGEGR